MNLFYNLPLTKDGHLELNLDYIYKSSNDDQAVKASNKGKANKFHIQYNGNYNVYLCISKLQLPHRGECKLLPEDELYKQDEDAVCIQYPSLCASAGITFNFPDKRLQLNIACHELFRKEYFDWEVRYYNINNKQKNNVDSRFCSIYLRYNINKTSRKNKVKDVDNVLNRL